MTDDKNTQTDLDLDKEIEQLDAFLDAHEEEFPLHDDEDMFAAPAKEDRQKSGGLGKYVSYVALLALLGGGGYAGYLYAPQLLQNSELSQLQAMMNNRNQSTSQPTEIIPPSTNYVAEVEEVIEQSSEDIVPTYDEAVESLNELPMPADDMVDDIAVSADGFGETMVEPEPELVQDAPAETIADALAIAQQATQDEAQDVSVINDDNVESNNADEIEKEIEIVSEETDADAVAVSDDTDVVLDKIADAEDAEIETLDDKQNSSGFVERISASPMVKNSDEIKEDVPAVENDVQEVAMISQEEEPVISDSEVVFDEVGAPKQTDVTSVESDEVENQDIVEVIEQVVPVFEPVKTPVQPVMVVETPKAVAVEKVEPKKQAVKQVNTQQKPTPKNNPAPKRSAQVIAAKKAYDAGDYQSAVDLYQGALNANPADTHALTGLQLAKAKLRMVQPSAPMQPVAETASTYNADEILEMEAVTIAPDQQNAEQITLGQNASVAQPVGNSLQSLISKMQSNPRDASTAVELAAAYANAGNKDQAMKYYRKALQLDVVFSAGLDRMAIYDAMANLGG